MKPAFPFLTLALFLLPGCALLNRARFDRGKEASAPADDRLVVWMLSDIKPATAAGRKDFEHAIADVRANVPEVDMAIIAGDLLKSRSTAADFDWFVETRNLANIPHWFEVAGNHDVRNRKLFQRYFPTPPCYAIEVGNLRFLCLSDESKASETELSDRTFDWWQRQVREHSGQILVTVSHAMLRHSGIFSAGIASRRIRKSVPFEEELKKSRVAVWASG